MNEIQILLCQGFTETVGCLLWQLIHLLTPYSISVTTHYPSVLVKSCIFFINECKADKGEDFSDSIRWGLNLSKGEP